MKVVKKELKEVFEPFKLELTFESKREVEVFFAFLNLSHNSTLRSVLKKEYSGASLPCYAWASPILK